jgi:hypothetical protein
MGRNVRAGTTVGFRVDQLFRKCFAGDMSTHRSDSNYETKREKSLDDIEEVSSANTSEYVPLGLSRSSI